MLKCKVIMHVCGMDDLDVIQRAVKNVIHECNKRRFESVALPAIGTGSGKLTPCAVAKAMIDTVTSVVPNSSLRMIRIVILNPQVFRSFAAALPHRGEPAADAGSANGAAKDEKQFCGPYESGEEVLPVVINVFGRDRASVLDALSRLKRIRDENFQELSALYPCPRRLPADFIGRLLQLGAQHGVRVTVERERVRARGERARAEAALASAGQLLEEAIKREWNELYSRVRWGYAYAGKEVGFEPGANFEIEQCHQNRSHETMVRSAGILFCINLDRKEATASEFKEVVKIRRSDSSSSV
ncbi:protein mono-ADP-ribosyltransferase PARP14-like [Scyliorhinus torazame]|uniref:protein mono-ADP-ribosyltransferase PARP14-like n=1 Tax=Scyliorhinus torazame TaxID=75743 RepID=UPI003B594D4F